MLEEKLRHSQCTGKHRHESFIAAQKQMQRGKNYKTKHWKGMPLAVYLCKFCDGYHIGKNVKGRKELS